MSPGDFATVKKGECATLAHLHKKHFVQYLFISNTLHSAKLSSFGGISQLVVMLRRKVNCQKQLWSQFYYHLNSFLNT